MTQVAVPVRPTDPPFLITLASRTTDGDANPRNWGADWMNPDTAMRYMRESLHRTDANGDWPQRVVIEATKRTPNAVEPMALTNGAGWESIEEIRKHILIEAIFDRRAEDQAAGRPKLSVGFYCGVIGNGQPGMIDNRLSDNVLNLDRDGDLDSFKRNWEPWIQCGVLSELWHDAGSMDRPEQPAGNRWLAVKNLLEDQKARFGLHGGTEAIKWLSEKGNGNFVWQDYDGVPMWCISRFILQRDPDNELNWFDDAEVWIMNAAHFIKTGPRKGERGLLTAAETRDFTRRGWGVGSWTRWYQADRMVNLPARGGVGR